MTGSDPKEKSGPKFGFLRGRRRAGRDFQFDLELLLRNRRQAMLRAWPRAWRGAAIAAKTG